MANLTPLDFYLCVLKPVTVFTGLVNGAPVEPFININWNTGATGSASTDGTSGAPIVGNTVWFGTSSGGRERGLVRLRSWTPVAIDNPATGAMVIAETDDVGPQIANGDNITIKLEWRLWSKAPRLVQSGGQVTYFEDFDVAYSDQTQNWYPTVVAGPPAVVFLEQGTGTVKFVGDRSTLHAPGATFSTHLWQAPGSVQGQASTQGTTGSPVIFDYTTAGQHMICYTATDSNGNEGTAYTWAFVVNKDNPTVNNAAYEDFEAGGDSFDWNSGGGEGSFVVHGVASVAQFPQEALVVMAADKALGTPTASWPFRENVLFMGHIIGNSVSQRPTQSQTTFRATSVQGLMAKLKQFPLSLRDKNGPTRWIDAQDITIDRVAAFMARWRSTLDTMTPIIFTGYTPEIARQDFGPSTLYSQLQNELMKDAWARVAVNHQGVLYFEIDYNLRLVAERSLAPTRKTLRKNVWVNAVDVVERQEYDLPTSVVKMSGIAYSGGGDPTTNVTPLFSEAPGDEVPRQFGSEAGGSSFILNDQTDLNIRTGFVLARETQRFPTLRMGFFNDGAFATVPQTVFPSQIEAADNNRGLAFPGTELIPRRVRRSYDQINGIVQVDVDFEVSSTGPAGVTISLPSEPPSQSTPGIVIEPPNDGWELTLGLMADNPNGTILYYGLGAGLTPTEDPAGQKWQKRRAGETGGDLRDLHAGVDPFWWTRFKKDTYNPDEAIFFKMGGGYVDRSNDAGRLTWTGVTPTSPVTVTGTSFVGLDSSVFTNKIHVIPGRWISSGTTNYTSGLWRTADDGATWTFTEM